MPWYMVNLLLRLEIRKHYFSKFISHKDCQINIFKEVVTFIFNFLKIFILFCTSTYLNIYEILSFKFCCIITSMVTSARNRLCWFYRFYYSMQQILEQDLYLLNKFPHFFRSSGLRRHLAAPTRRRSFHFMMPSHVVFVV